MAPRKHTGTTGADELPTHEKPCAAAGLTSYRYPSAFGWIMIGATDDDDALHEAARSLSSGSTPDPHQLERWDGQGYVLTLVES